MYRDMSARDLLERRTTNENGDTIWEKSPLIDAALNGRLAVLDGIEHLGSGTLASLQSLIHDRTITLPDGTSLIGENLFNELQKRENLSEKQLNELGTFKIPSSFRILSIAGTMPTGNGPHWLTEEVLFEEKEKKVKVKKKKVKEKTKRWLLSFNLSK